MHFWYILIHVGLGLVGYQVFLFDNIGGLWSALAAGIVQAYAIWEIHKLAKPKFEASLAAAASFKVRGEMLREYQIRLLRTWFFRTCIYALLTLIVAMIVGGG
jgi:hypothetical protein